jgi:hypothetical protein
MNPLCWRFPSNCKEFCHIRVSAASQGGEKGQIVAREQWPDARGQREQPPASARPAAAARRQPGYGPATRAGVVLRIVRIRSRSCVVIRTIRTIRSWLFSVPVLLSIRGCTGPESPPPSRGRSYKLIVKGSSRGRSYKLIFLPRRCSHICEPAISSKKTGA